MNWQSRGSSKIWLKGLMAISRRDGKPILATNSSRYSPIPRKSRKVSEGRAIHRAGGGVILNGEEEAAEWKPTVNYSSWIKVDKAVARSSGET
jgi:hypothetical protein